ncbi:MAG: GspE/PulE family protein [Kiritimatiellaeota bacterium]|nr:GspE/PulE family protein [Kiritimatiellota bacterium]
MSPKHDSLCDLLITNGVLDAAQAGEFLEECEKSGHTFREHILDSGELSEDDLLGMMAAYQGCEVMDLSEIEIPQETLKSIPASVARMYNVIPVAASPGAVTLATSNLLEPSAMDELMFVLTRDVQLAMAREADVTARVAQFYGDDSAAVADMFSSAQTALEQDISLNAGAEEDDITNIESQAASSQIVRFVNLVLYQAVVDRASDIHFEPFEREMKIRYRVDGALYEMKQPPYRLANAITARVKVMSNLNIAERRLPQDGRIPLTVAGRHVDLRVSTLPTRFGESVVLRVLDRSVVALDIENIGLPEDVLEQILMDIEKPNGIIIVTGPTGSGKTTTLYSALKKISTIDLKLLTAEEPVEYDIDGIVQVPINPIAGNTFPIVLRAFLRQDPDIMMIGEIRDLETAEIAVQASLTGHLVFSTLHTNDAAGAVTRLIDMDVPPYLISSTLEAVLGQRLTRTICPNCKTPYVPDDDLLRRLNLTRADVGDRGFFYGRGCSFCNNTGYKGRKGVFEYLRVSNPIRDLINARQPTLLIKEKARQLGMRTMREDGVRNVLDGYTTVDEILRYT